jgi:spore coat-associated protein N
MFSKKTLLSMLIVGVVATVAGAGTWAAFSDTETSTGNTFTAGTLDLVVGSVGASLPLAVENVYPQATGTIGTINVANAGTIDGTLSLKIINIQDDENGVNDPESKMGDTDATGELSSHLTIYANGNVVTPGTAMPIGALVAGSNQDILLTYSVDDADNSIQTDKTTFDTEFTLDQA